MPAARDSGGLHIVFAIFLGLMLATFAGVSVYTFYGPPEGPGERIRELDREDMGIRDVSAPGEMPEADRERLQAIAAERDSLRTAATEARKPWSRNTSVILIAFATLAMAVSLVRADQLPVISNGLLLGGLFTMVYGIGWIVVTDTSFTRFVVMTVALAITLGLGYVRFVRRGRVPGEGGGGGGSGTGSAGAPEIERRVRELERRMGEAARALGAGGDRGEGAGDR